MKLNKIYLTPILLCLFIHSAIADNYLRGLHISHIRSVGDFIEGDTYDNTIELWFKGQALWSAESGCSGPHNRVYINAGNSHMVSAAYLALASNREIGVNVDNTLPIRAGSCEASYLDVY